MFSIIAHHFLFCNNFFVKLFCKILAPVTIPLFNSSTAGFKSDEIRALFLNVFYGDGGYVRDSAPGNKGN